MHRFDDPSDAREAMCKVCCLGYNHHVASEYRV